MRRHLRYANVVSTLALVFAMGTGGAYAAQKISGKLLKNRTVSGAKVKRNTLTGKEIRESKLTTVPRASNALKLGGKPPSAYLASGATAASARTAGTAANAGALGGIGPSGFVQGGGTHTSGRATGAGSATPNVFKTFTTPVGEFRLSCGVANVDARYFNTTPGDADVFRSSINGSTPSAVYDPIAAGGDAGFAATANPAYVDIRAGKGSAAATLRVGERREGANCIVDWELVTSG